VFKGQKSPGTTHVPLGSAQASDWNSGVWTRGLPWQVPVLPLRAGVLARLTAFKVAPPTTLSCGRVCRSRDSALYNLAAIACGFIHVRYTFRLYEFVKR
jgi:hypothetical protein